MRGEVSVLRIQKDLRMKAYRELCSSALYIQRGMRGLAARNEFRSRRQTRAAIAIQSQCRKYLAHLHYMRLKKAAVTTQCVWRGRVDRKKLWKPWNLSLHIYSQHNNCIERVIPSERFCASENRRDLRRPRVARALLFQTALIGWQGQLLGTLCL